MLKPFVFRGSRILKTGIAVFITALICQALDWPPAFAVITAIVTIDPTIHDSIRKAAIRFPASAIGAFYTVVLVSIFGHAPITYTLSAVLTIWTTYKLNLQAGLLVATLTAVAMVDVVHSNFFVAFFTRLGSTTVGLLVSIAVNIFISPPEYSEAIQKHLHNIARQIGETLQRMSYFLLTNTAPDEALKRKLRMIHQEIRLTEPLIRFQQQDAHYTFIRPPATDFSSSEQLLIYYEKILHRLEVMFAALPVTSSWTEKEKEQLDAIIRQIGEAIESNERFDQKAIERQLTDRLLHYENEPINTLSAKRTVTYELLALTRLQHPINHANEKRSSD